MKITFITIPGKVQELALPEGASVGDALWELGLYDDECRSISLNGRYTFLDHRLADGDRLLCARSIIGRAPVPAQEKEQRVRILHEFTTGAKKLVIIDPYILRKPSYLDVHDYVDMVCNAVGLRRGTLEQLHLIGNRRDSEAVLPALEEICHQYRCTLVYKQTNDVHDRIWIKDGKEALVVGTSLNYLGYHRLSFILPLPEEDLRFLKTFLCRRGLM